MAMSVAFISYGEEAERQQTNDNGDFWSELLASSEAFRQAKCQKEGLFFRCLSGYESSYFGYVGRDENHLDGSHLEFKVSIKYPLWGSLVDLDDSTKEDKRSQALYFAYTGKYDFYFGSRYSAPVISRQQNPGIFYQYQYDSRESGFQHFSLGYFHESNGQEIDDQQMFDSKVIELLDKICRENESNQCITDSRHQQEARAMATDYLSRGWDYLAASTKYTKRHSHDLFGRKIAVQTDFYFSARSYFNWQGLGFVEGREENIDWLADIDNPGDKVYDYRTFQLTINRKLDSLACEANQSRAQCLANNNPANWFDYMADNTEWNLTLMSGNELNHLSYQLEFIHYIAGHFPLKLMYFNGYGENISTYQRKSSYWMIGIDLW
ncbi:phospholipase A [Thalassotalea insulae]|nr:phospholipase A [Thalassotalea insulae]